MLRRHSRVVGSLLALLSNLASFDACAQAAPEMPAPESPAPAVEPDLPSRAAPTNLALTGAAVTGVWYGGALGASLVWSNGPWAPDMRIPVVGPWLALDDLECRGELNCTTALEVVRYVLVGIDGVGQAAGLAFLLESLFVPTAAPRREKPRGASLRPVPFVAGDALGLGVVGEL